MIEIKTYCKFSQNKKDDYMLLCDKKKITALASSNQDNGTGYFYLLTTLHAIS